MKILIFEKFDESYLREEEWLVALSPVSCDLDDIAIADKKSEEEIHAFLDKNKAIIQQNQIVLVSLFNLSLGLQIAHHIRLTEEYKRLPILLFGNIEETEIHKQQNDLSHICYTKGTRYFLEDDLTQQWLLSTVEELNKELNELLKDDDTFRDGFLKKIIIREPDKTGRHSIANEWGAYRMAQVAGLDITKFNYPKTLYFKYLLAQSKPPKPATVNFSTIKKILFIDDNHQKGWKDCLEGLFGVGKIDDTFESWEKAKDAKANEKIEKDEYDLVFLDFYLGEGDTIGEGKRVLKDIKGLNPVLPVVMFTASNKAWNMHDLNQAGADGYYVKEHPETAQDSEFSVKNFENFQKTVNRCTEKGTILRKFWKQIKLIEKSTLLIDKPNQINKERINERLTMFIGLLKKAREQTTFDTNTFFYSDWELAFLTLWSTLNEIQEVWYEKTALNYPNTSFQFKNSAQNRPYLRDKKEWKFINGNKDFIRYDLTFRFDSSSGNAGKYQAKQKSVLKYDRRTEPYYFIEASFKETFVNLEITLHAQIAFLLLNLNATNSLLINLKELNEARNQLYLTHGDDSSSPNFAVLYQDQRRTDTDWQEKIKQLFEIVYFLCKGKECAW